METRRKRILVAEDDLATAELLRRSLSQTYDVVVVNNGPAAIDQASREPRPELMILDIMMPGADGLQVATAVRAQPELKKVPIIFLTAKDRPLDVIAGIKVGARHYMTKPFKLADLLDKVKRAVGE